MIFIITLSSIVLATKTRQRNLLNEFPQHFRFCVWFAFNHSNWILDLYFSNVNHGGGSSNSALLLAWEGQSSGSSIKHYRPTDLKATGFGGSWMSIWSTFTLIKGSTLKIKVILWHNHALFSRRGRRNKPF